METIIFFLNVFNEVNNLDFEIKSEESLEKRRNSLRPDISIWNRSAPETELLAVIECKTQLGWQRHTWEQCFTEREHKIKKKFPKAQVFLVVMSGCNWPGFGKDERVGKQLFCLLKNGGDNWPTELPINYYDSCLENRIELLFEQLRNLR